jgi:hypothetical protein
MRPGSADEQAGERAVDTVATAAPTLFGWTTPLVGNDDLRQVWTKAFALTFAAELRAERLSRSSAIVEADPDRYERFGRAVMQSVAGAPVRSHREAQRWWRRKQRKGKLYSIPRLAKASATFAGGADYIVWKINRHAGTEITLKPWHQRHPLIAAITLLPRLLKSGAVR